MSGFNMLLLAVVVVLVILPPKYDPAIRLKERNERRRKRGEGQP